MYRLGEGFEEALRTEPEFGMGYHVAERRIHRRRSEPETLIIYNMEVAFRIEDLNELEYLNYQEMIENQMGFGEFVAQKLTLEPLEYDDNTITLNSQLMELGDEFPDETFSPSPRLDRYTRPFEGFVRVSAYPNDKRVNQQDGSVEKGTYATTISDLAEVPTGYAATGRYALKNPAPASFIYPIIPRKSVRITGGTVRPAYGQSGGGVEVRFQEKVPTRSALPTPYYISEI